MFFLHVTDVTYLEGYRLRLAFDDGAVKDVDLTGELYGEVFEPLKELAFFKRAFLNSDTGTVEWPNGADFAPEFLYAAGGEIGRGPQAARLRQTPHSQ
jgi:hypothetical protein